MILAGIGAYLIALYIRPQDWAAAFLDAPVYWYISIFLAIAVATDDESERQLWALPQNVLLAAYLALIFVITALKATLEIAFDQFIIYLKHATIYFLFYMGLTRTSQLVATARMTAAAIGFVAIQSIYQYSTGIGWAGQAVQDWRGSEAAAALRAAWVGAWDGPNVLSLLFVLGSGLLLEACFSPNPVMSRWIALPGLGLLYGAMFTANSRGGFLGLFAMLAAFALYRFRKSLGRAALVGVVVGAIILAAMPSRMSQLSSKESSAGERLWVWEMSLNVLERNPLLGVGKGQLNRYTYKHLMAHSNYVQNMVEMGLLGFLVWLGILYYTFRGLYLVGREETRTPEHAELQSLARGLFFAQFGFAVATLFVTMELDLVYAWWGLSAATINVARSTIPAEELTFRRRDLYVIVGGMLAVFLFLYLTAIKRLL